MCVRYGEVWVCGGGMDEWEWFGCVCEIWICMEIWVCGGGMGACGGGMGVWGRYGYVWGGMGVWWRYGCVGRYGYVREEWCVWGRYGCVGEVWVYGGGMVCDSKVLHEIHTVHIHSVWFYINCHNI